VFATISCLFARVPLLIVGPPGTSKTLAVNVVADNANGSDSVNPFFRSRPRLDLFLYQCSKLSTSKEIANVFEQAQQRQNRVDRDKHVCAVFMDEAGLPEESKESLKVLHYLLEGHMSARPDVGFVAISSHVLDAAKSNRCVMLMRPEPDEQEIQSIASGLLLGMRQDGQARIHDFDVDGTVIGAPNFISLICESYMDLLRTSDFGTWFGLRDFVYFLRYLHEKAQSSGTRIILPIAVLVAAIERNFNGVCHQEFLDVSNCFLAKIVSEKSRSTHHQCFRHPIMVLKDALATIGHSNVAARPRFKMIIDGTEDDSILRLLRAGNVINVTGKSLFMLSNLTENVESERLRLISGVKYAALQGNLAVLSQTDSINESFYDLTNQRFSEITDRNGKPTFYTDIAVGGISR
jgi:ATPase family associated with various cellular activities (AAA)